MDFIKYPSLTNVSREGLIDWCINYGFATDNVWYVTEKIHGANFAFYVDYNTQEVRCAKRTGFLNKLENFYNFSYVQGKYTNNVLALTKHLGKSVILYGELCGGWYDGRSTGQKVQKEVLYCPHNEFVVFDIVCGNELKSPIEVQELCWEFGLVPAPLISYGTLQEALVVDNAFPTLIPKRFGLPEFPDNICEGTVIKPWPIVRDMHGELVVFKNKNAKFSESSRTKKPYIVKELTPELQALLDKLIPEITVNRLNATISKVGNDPKQFGQVRGYFIQDIIQDSGAHEEYHALEGQQRKIIHNELDKLVLPMIRKGLGVE